MNEAQLTVRQMGYEARSFLRNPPAVFFGLLLPLLFLVIFATIFGNETIEQRGGIKTSTFYVPTIIALGVVSTTFMNLSISLVVMRENLRLKRLRGTPLSARTFIAGKVSTALGFALFLTLVVLLFGWLAYDVSVPDATLPGLIAGVVVGAVSFCCLGTAISAAVPNEDAAAPLLNLVLLPLYFISGIFFDTSDAPSWLNSVADVFPIKHLSEALLAVVEPGTDAPGIEWVHLAVVAGWGLLGLLLALRFFRWTPKGE